MKYIRTKETDCFIIDTIKYKEITGEDCFIPKNEIVDEANTIEELCDEFVYANKKKDIKCFCLFHQPITTIYYGAKLEDIETKKLINDKNVEIYGAVWTDKGLIYVAKMNDKGELELL